MSIIFHMASASFLQNRGELGYDKKYFEELTGQHKVEVIKGGQIVGHSWEPRHSGAQDHALDMRIYNMGAAEHTFIVAKQEIAALRNLETIEAITLEDVFDFFQDIIDADVS